jgi:hypothetical protein
MPNILDLQDLYSESLVRELVEKTKNGGVTWVAIGSTQFHATETQPSECVDPVSASVTWDFYISKTQIGTMSYKYQLDVKKDNVNQISIVDGPLPHTARDSVTKSLYEIVEILVLQLDQKVKTALQFVQGLEGANG